MATDPAPRPATQPHHPMRVVMRRTGLGADLLRAWEKRHGVVAPGRSASGRRLYSDADVARLQLLARATLAGRTIGQVAPLPDADLADLVRRDAEAAAAAGLPAAAGPAGPVAAAPLRAALRAVERLDAGRLDAVLRRALVVLPAELFLDAVAAPLLEQAGAPWDDGALRAVHGQLARLGTRRALDRLLDATAASRAAPALLAAAPPGERHEPGALLVAAVAAVEGWRVTFLGAGLPAEALAEAARATRARAVALGVAPAALPAADAAIADELRRLAALLPAGVPLLVGGGAAAAYGGLLRELGGAALPDAGALRRRLRALRRQAAGAT